MKAIWERWLNHVPEHAAFPGHMVEPASNAAPRGIAFERGESESLGSQDQHDEAAKGVERQIAFRGRPGFKRGGWGQDAFFRTRESCGHSCTSWTTMDIENST